MILTNQNCYLLQADNGVKKIWETPYESAGAKESKEGDETTGGGLAWGSGCSPSLTKDLVMFTDNQETVNLLALDMKTGEVVASLPVIDELPEGSQVSVENSAIVYDNGAGTVSTIVVTGLVQEVPTWEKRTVIPPFRVIPIFMMKIG